MAGAEGGGVSVVVSRERFEEILYRRYGQAREKLFEKAKQILGNENIRKSVCGHCNAVLSQAMKVGIETALKTGANEVKVQVNTDAAGKRLWKSWPAPLRQKIADGTVVLALELMLLDRGWPVAVGTHTVECTFSLVEEDEEPEGVEVVEEEPEEGTVDSAAAELPALTDGGSNGLEESSDFGEHAGQ